MADGGQDHTQKMLALLLKSSPSTVVEKSIENAGFKLFREMEVYQAVQLIITTPASEYVQKNATTVVKLRISQISTKSSLYSCGAKKLVPHITKDTFATEKLYLNITGEKSQFITVIFVKDLIQ